MLDGWIIACVERVEPDAAGVDLGPDVAVAEQHGPTLPPGPSLVASPVSTGLVSTSSTTGIAQPAEMKATPESVTTTPTSWTARSRSCRTARASSTVITGYSDASTLTIET